MHERAPAHRKPSKIVITHDGIRPVPSGKLMAPSKTIGHTSRVDCAGLNRAVALTGRGTGMDRRELLRSSAALPAGTLVTTPAPSITQRSPPFVLLRTNPVQRHGNAYLLVGPDPTGRAPRQGHLDAAVEHCTKDCGADVLAARSDIATETVWLSLSSFVSQRSSGRFLALSAVAIWFTLYLSNTRQPSPG